MCNYSDGIEEKGFNRGRAEGMDYAFSMLAEKFRKQGMTDTEIKELLAI